MECEFDSLEVIRLICSEEKNHVCRTLVADIQQWMSKD